MSNYQPPSPSRRVPLTQGSVPKTKMRLVTPQSQAADAAAAAAAAQAEYAKQMEDYQKQMAEYERQVAAANQAQAAAAAAAAAAAPVATPEPAPAPTVDNIPISRPAAHVSEAPSVPTIPSAAPATTAPAPTPIPTPLPQALPQAAYQPAPAAAAANQPAPAANTAAATAPAPAANAAPKFRVAGMGGSGKKAGTAARVAANRVAAGAAAAHVPQEQQGAEAEQQQATAPRDNNTYLDSLANKPKPFWKRPIVIASAIFFVVIGGYSLFAYLNNERKREAVMAHFNLIDRLLSQATKLNRARVETVADAKKKNLTIDCNMEEAKALMSLIVDPYVKNEYDKPRYGSGKRPEDVAKVACYFLGLVAEKDPAVEKMVFAELAKNAPKMRPALSFWLLQRMMKAQVKNLGGKLLKLEGQISKMPKFKAQNEMLTDIWELMGLYVTEKDVDRILDRLHEKDASAQLARVLANNLDTIVIMSKDEKLKEEIGDKMFNRIPEKFRTGHVMHTLATAKSQLALAHYKESIKDKNRWHHDLGFFGTWPSDEFLPMLVEMRNDPANEKFVPYIDRAVGRLFMQNRDRDPATLQTIIPLLFPKALEDSSDWSDVINKVDPHAASFIGKDSPEYPALEARRQELDAIRGDKKKFIQALGNMYERPWIVAELNKYLDDPDADIQSTAQSALEKIKTNEEKDKKAEEKYRARLKTNE